MLVSLNKVWPILNYLSLKNYVYNCLIFVMDYTLTFV